jgi:hypothetical protein
MGMLGRLVRTVRSSVEAVWLTARINVKWLTDKRHLPLTTDHWALYDIIHRFCWRELQDLPNLIECRDFNDRIQWLKLFDQSADIIRCSDKIAVRDFIRQRVGDKYLIGLYQVCDHFHEIDFQRLPGSFVIKANHDWGSVELVTDKETIDLTALEGRFESALSASFGVESGEWAYRHICPKIFVEGYIGDPCNGPPPDYKFQCVDGVVKFCRFTCDRGIDTKEIVLDRNGDSLGMVMDERFKLLSIFQKPEEWEQLVDIAEKLAQGFKCVRVDLYFAGGKIYVGEMTFFPMAGVYAGEGQKRLGHYLDFDRTTFKPLISTIPDRTSRR